MNFKNIPIWRTLGICAVFIAANFSNPAYSKSNILGKILEVDYTYKCRGIIKSTERFKSIIRILGNGSILFEWKNGKGIGIQFKLNSTIKTKYKESLYWIVNGKKVWKSHIVPVKATASEKGDWLKLNYSRNARYLNPKGEKIHRVSKNIESVKISGNKCSSFSAKSVGWGRNNGGKKRNFTCKSSNARCKLK